MDSYINTYMLTYCDTHTYIHIHAIYYLHTCVCIGFRGGTSGKEPAYQSGDIRDTGLITGSGRSPERGHSVLQYSCLENLGTEELGGLQFIGSQRESVCVCVYIHIHLTLSHAAQVGYVILF